MYTLNHNGCDGEGFTKNALNHVFLFMKRIHGTGIISGGDRSEKKAYAEQMADPSYQKNYTIV